MKRFEHYAVLADLWRYPGSGFPEAVQRAAVMLGSRCHDAAEELNFFAGYMLSASEDEREELFTKTFDVQPICYLELGYVIFGEDYKRGAFLLHMQEEQKNAGNECGTELPDHLSCMLEFFAKTENEKLVEELAVSILIPGVKKMIAEFDSARVDLKLSVLRKLHKAIITEELNRGNVYRHTFNALLLLLEQDFGKTIIRNHENDQMKDDRNKMFFGKRDPKQMRSGQEYEKLASTYKLD